MDRRILYNHFSGNASDEETSLIRRWVESTPQNRESYMNERVFFDAFQLINIQKDPSKRSTSAFMGTNVFLKVAAILIIALLSSICFLMTEKKEVRLSMNSISVPAGQRANIVLSDGTQVWLNSRTKFSYPAVFTGDKREVYLDGEAFFDVTKSKNNKFVVHTDRCNVEVFGTKFNVEAYADSKDFYTALIDGSVKVINNKNPENSILLSPNYQASINKNGLISSMPIEDYDLYRWRDGLICFKNTGFEELMHRFEKCYGIRIVIDNENLSDYVCTGKFRISDGIDYALRLLQGNAKYTFERNTDDTIIYIK